MVHKSLTGEICMHKVRFACVLAAVLLLAAFAAPAQERTTAQLEQEVEKLKKTIDNLEKRLEAQENAAKPGNETPEAAGQPQKVESSSAEEIKTKIDDMEKRLDAAELKQAQDRLRFSGDYRFEAHSIWADVPEHYDGMQLQNMVVKTLFATPILGRPPQSVDEINNTVSTHYADYLQFTSNLTFSQLKQAMGSIPPDMQQQLFGMLLPGTYVPAYSNDNSILYTNRLRLKFDAKVSENVSFSGRLSMYKVFGDSTGVQVFNGQPNSFNIDGTTTSVPNSDQVRIDRAYFSWNNIGGSKLYLSIGRRPSTNGPPMNYRDDEPRGGTPMASLIDYQFDGITVGYSINDYMVWRVCYGLGYESGFGNGNLLKMPQDRLKDVHFLGLNTDLYNSETTLVQVTYAHAFDVTDGFTGLIVLTANPLTGDPVGAPVVMRYSPTANLGSINLLGGVVTRRQGPLDLYGSLNYSGTRPNGTTTPFGGLMSDPFETPEDHDGFMVLGGIRVNFPNDERTKVGFEYNHGSQYWFNFAQAQDDIIAPKTNVRGNVYETYLTHRISNNFIVKADYIYYDYDYSGSGWHVGAPKPLDSTPVLGYPTYDRAQKAALSLIARF
jgi:hypothetical protein